MKYILFAFIITCSTLTFFSTQAMNHDFDQDNTTIQDRDFELIIPISQNNETDIYLITPDQIIDYINAHAGLHIKKIIHNVSMLDIKDQEQLAAAVRNTFPLIEWGFNQAIAELPSNTTITNITDMANILGFTGGEGLSEDALSFYINALKEPSTDSSILGNHPSETIIELHNKNPDTVNADILRAIHKIVHYSLTQDKPLFGILLAHNTVTKQILITPAPQRKTNRFDVGGVLSLGLNLAKGIDQELTNLENNDALSPKEKACVRRVHKPLIIIISVMVITLMVWQFGTQIYTIIRGTGNSTNH